MSELVDSFLRIHPIDSTGESGIDLKRKPKPIENQRRGKPQSEPERSFQEILSAELKKQRANNSQTGHGGRFVTKMEPKDPAEIQRFIDEGSKLSDEDLARNKRNAEDPEAQLRRFWDSFGA